jgi:hypothetical protein
MSSETQIHPEVVSAGILLPKKQSYFKKLGAGSLGISIFLHAAIVVVGIFLVIATIPPEKPKEVDFKPSGGGGGAPSNSNQKKMQTNMSKQLPNRVAASNVAGSFSLPEPTSTSSMSALGALGSGGMGGLGSGGGKGDGKGMGTGDGMGMGIGGAGPKGLMVFGTALNVRSIGVVMDVSGSMTRHLPKVLEELDRVAKGSPVILHVGCGIDDIRTRPNIDAVDSPMKKGVDHFKFFWCLYQDPQYRESGVYFRDKVDLSRPIPSPDVYEKFARRSGTFYNDPESRRSTADAILAKQFEKVDAIYWFADFQDKIDPKAAEDVLRTLKRRKQKLYIHASEQGNYIDAARDLISVPSGGKEIVVDTRKK